METFSLPNLDAAEREKDPDAKTAYDEMTARRDAAKRVFQDAEQGWHDVRQEMLDDIKFYHGDQWTDALKAVGKIKREPNLTVNRLPQFVKQVESQMRQQEITLAVSPTDEAGSEETADIYNGLIRNIQNESKAHTHYIHASGENGMLVPGQGFLKVDLDYVNDSSFDQKITIGSVFDPFSVLYDPSSTLPDGSDAAYWFEIFDYTNSEYCDLFPRSKLASADLTSVGSEMTKWVMFNKGVRVIRYWYKEEIEVIKYLLEDGQVIDSMKYAGPQTHDEMMKTKSEMDGRLPFPTDEQGKERIISRTRKTIDTKIKWMTFNGAEILEEGTWAGKFFPFVAVTGPQMVVDGRRTIRGIIHYAKDSQRMLNYMASSAARRIGSANKAPWIVDAKSIAPYQKQWQTANTENWSMLMWDQFRTEKDANGTPLQNPQPFRADQTGQINDLLSAATKFENDLKAVIGIYDAGLGATPNEQSGVAIKTLAQQGSNSNFHFADNLVLAVERLGCVIIDLIPKVYSGPRVVRIVNPDTTEEVVKINQMFTLNGQQKKYDLTQGEYAVKCNTGPAFATKKQAALEQLLEICRVDPQLTPVLQDLMVGAMEFSGSEIAKERLVKLFAQQFPNLQDVKNGLPPIPPQAQAQLQQATGMVQQLTQQLHAVTDEYEKLKQKDAAEVTKQQGQIAIDNNQSRIEMLLEKERAERDALNNQAKLHLEEVKLRLSHIEEMNKLLVPLHMKQKE